MSFNLKEVVLSLDIHVHVAEACPAGADPQNEAWVLNVLNNSTITNMQLNNWLGSYPRSVRALLPGTNMQQQHSYMTHSHAPDTTQMS